MSSSTAADTVADSDAILSFDIDDTSVTFRTRPTRARLVSTMLRQRSVSQNVATSRVPTRSTPTLPHHIAVHTAECSSTDKMHPQSSLSTMQSSADVSVSEDIVEHALSPSLGKLSSAQRRRSSITRADAVESSLSLTCSECTLKTDSDELRPLTVEPATVSRDEALLSQDSISSWVSPTVAVTFDSSAEHSECQSFEATVSQISPIARNNQPLVQHLMSPAVQLQQDAVDIKKIPVSPVSDIKHPVMGVSVKSCTLAAESKTSYSLHKLPSSSVTSRQPLSMRIDASKSTTSSCNSATAAVTTKSNVIAPRFVSYCLSVIVTYLVTNSN